MLKIFNNKRRNMGIVWELLGVVILSLLFNNFLISLLYGIGRILIYPVYSKLWK